MLKAVCWMFISLCSALTCTCLILCLPACFETTAHWRCLHEPYNRSSVECPSNGTQKTNPCTVAAGTPASRNGKSFEVRFRADLGSTEPSVPKAESEMDELLSPRSKRQRPKDEPYTAPRTFLPQRLAGLQSTYHDAASDDSRDAGEVEKGNARAEELLEMNQNFAQSLPEPSRLGQIRATPAGAWTRLRKLLWRLLSCCMKKKVAPSEASFFSKCLFVCFTREVAVNLNFLYGTGILFTCMRQFQRCCTLLFGHLSCPQFCPKACCMMLLCNSKIEYIKRHSHKADDHVDDDDNHNNVMVQLILPTMSCITKLVPVSSQKFPITKAHSQGVASHNSALQSSHMCVQLQHNSVKLGAASVYQGVCISTQYLWSAYEVPSPLS